MKRKIQFIPFILLLLLLPGRTTAQYNDNAVFQVKGLSIEVPRPKDVDRFVKFIGDELAPRGVNTLFLLEALNYKFRSYPQLADSLALTTSEVKKIVSACRKYKIRIIPQINLLGHQSWGTNVGILLKTFPEFDETPHIKVEDARKVSPAEGGLYCKSYCPLHPDLHKVLFAVIDEVCDVYEADAFHGGMDEIFYIGDDRCPRCRGYDKAQLFADEVRRIYDHLKSKNRELWIWGDRLIDGRTTGYGIWEASFNSTYRAVDLIPKDVVICDWHYERPDQSAVYFAMKGFRVVTCPWRTPSTAIIQTDDMARWRKYATPEMKPRYYGMVATTWMDNGSFIDGFQGNLTETAKRSVHPKNPAYTPWDTFRAMFQRMNELEKEK